MGEETLGRIINVIGDPIDERGPVQTDKTLAIHAEAPEFQEMSVEQEILVTGIKVIFIQTSLWNLMILFCVQYLNFTDLKSNGPILSQH